MVLKRVMANHLVFIIEKLINDTIILYKKNGQVFIQQLDHFLCSKKFALHGAFSSYVRKYYMLRKKY